MRIFTGCACALVTPFDAEGRLDAAALARLVRWHIGRGTDALVVCGTTGEASTMTEREQAEAAANAVEAADGRVPVIVGVGGNDTRRVIAACKAARAAGADGALAVTPYYNKTTQEGLIAHYTAVAEASEIPLILYNVPGRTGLNLRPETAAALARHENIAGMKEASGDMAQTMEAIRLCGAEFAVYSGCDELTLPVLACGGAGVISTAANVVPEKMRALCTLYFSGDIAGARKMQQALAPLISALFARVNPIPVKAAAAILGLCENNVRLPLVAMRPEETGGLRELLAELAC